jgi:hypothetical protein
MLCRTDTGRISLRRATHVRQPTILKERTREMWTFPFLETLWRDFTYAFRTPTKTSGFTSVVVVTLALGRGASTAIFSVIEPVLIELFPYRDAKRFQATQLWQVSAHNPITIACVAALLLATGALACWVPVRRHQHEAWHGVAPRLTQEESCSYDG